MLKQVILTCSQTVPRKTPSCSQACIGCHAPCWFYSCNSNCRRYFYSCYLHLFAVILTTLMVLTMLVQFFIFLERIQTALSQRRSDIYIPHSQTELLRPPVLCPGRLFLRSLHHLGCGGQQRIPPVVPKQPLLWLITTVCSFREEGMSSPGLQQKLCRSTSEPELLYWSGTLHLLLYRRSILHHLKRQRNRFILPVVGLHQQTRTLWTATFEVQQLRCPNLRPWISTRAEFWPLFIYRTGSSVALDILRCVLDVWKFITYSVPAASLAPSAPLEGIWPYFHSSWLYRSLVDVLSRFFLNFLVLVDVKVRMYGNRV